MWGLSNIREYKSLSSFFVQFFLTENIFHITSKQLFFNKQINLIFFSKSSTMFYENKTWGLSNIREYKSLSLLYSFSLYRKLLSKTNFQTVFQTSRLLIKRSTMFYKIKHGPPHRYKSHSRT